VAPDTIDLRRRALLKQGAFVLAGLSAGSFSWLGSSSSSGHANPNNSTIGNNNGQNGGGSVASKQTVSFGWEVINFNGNGANVFFRVLKNIILSSLNVDVALMITSPPSNPGFTEILCQGSVSRGATPNFGNAERAVYLPVVASGDFGVVTLSNPNNLVAVFNSTLAQDVFYSIILKAFVPGDGSASSASRQVLAQPQLQLNAGDYLMFHMDHAGVPCDGEMQVVLNYTLL
jgi:hypothetical protein